MVHSVFFPNIVCGVISIVYICKKSKMKSIILFCNRKIVFLLFFTVCTYSGVYSQMLVDNNGNVAIKYLDDAPVSSYFSINSPGSSDICTYIRSNEDNISTALKILKTGGDDMDPYNTKGIDCFVRGKQNSSDKIYGIYSAAYKENSVDTHSGRTYGVYGAAGNATPGYNYGLFGTLIGANNGAGVYGSSTSLDGGAPLSGRYAGYFSGNVKVTLSVYASSFNVPSDYRIKRNIRTIGDDCIDNLMKINVVKYELKDNNVEKEVNDTIATMGDDSLEKNNLLSKEHYGVVAQELQSIYPNLVYEGSDGTLSVNYIEIIPLLIKSIQALNEVVSAFQTNTEEYNKLAMPINNHRGNATITKISLSEKLSITCNIPENVTKSVLYIWDTNGTEMYHVVISEHGCVETVVEGEEMDEGIYVCSLITNDEAIDTRRFYFGK